MKSGLFDTVMVSTDDREIAKIAMDCGAEVPFYRSKNNADDFSTTADVILEVLERYAEDNVSFDVACCIYPTAPLLKPKTLMAAFDLMVERNFSTVFPVVPFSYPIKRSLQLEEGGQVKMNWPEYLNTRSQDLESAYHDAGQFYWLRVPLFLAEKKLFGANSGSIVLSEIEVQDIDTDADWKIAELKMQLL